MPNWVWSLLFSFLLFKFYNRFFIFDVCELQKWYKVWNIQSWVDGFLLSYYYVLHLWLIRRFFCGALWQHWRLQECSARLACTNGIRASCRTNGTKSSMCVCVSTRGMWFSHLCTCSLGRPLAYKDWGRSTLVPSCYAYARGELPMDCPNCRSGYRAGP